MLFTGVLILGVNKYSNCENGTHCIRTSPWVSEERQGLGEFQEAAGLSGLCSIGSCVY